MTTMKRKAAYRFVDLKALEPLVRAEVTEDAQAGGGNYGLKVVEEAVDGPSRVPIYGVYFGDDEEKWREAQRRLQVRDGSLVDIDEEAEDALRAEASAGADAEAAAIRRKEEAAVTAVTGGDEDDQAQAAQVVAEGRTAGMKTGDETNDGKDRTTELPKETTVTTGKTNKAK